MAKLHQKVRLAVGGADGSELPQVLWVAHKVCCDKATLDIHDACGSALQQTQEGQKAAEWCGVELWNVGCPCSLYAVE